MLKIKEYVKANSLEQAYMLNQKKSACVLGGMVWLKMGNRNVGTAIDLSGLGLDKIEESGEEFSIGCMTSLRALETNGPIQKYTNGAVRESLRHIVGVQFRNCATVGGSIYGRYGFSDVLTMLLALDSYVEMYKGGRIPLKEFAQQKPDRDILVRIIIKKNRMHTAYVSQRNASTDFPVLTCAAAVDEYGVKVSIGARPSRALVYEKKMPTTSGCLGLSKEEWERQAEAFAEELKAEVQTGSNMRASSEYRSHLVSVLVKRALAAAGGMEVC